MSVMTVQHKRTSGRSTSLASTLLRCSQILPAEKGQETSHVTCALITGRNHRVGCLKNALAFLRVYSMYSCHIRVRMKLVPADFGASKGKYFGV
jgi:hypothetical protein